MTHDNFGSQSGDHSINVGTGDFRGAHIQVGDQGHPIFTSQQMQVKRKLLLGGASVQRESLSAFSIVGCLASFAGLYFTLFPPFRRPEYANWSFAFLFALGIAATCWLVSMTMKRHGFAHFLMGRIYLEQAPNGRIFITKLSAVCPWCGSRMKLQHCAPKDVTPRDIFFCEKNPAQHNIWCDHTFLPEVDTPET